MNLIVDLCQTLAAPAGREPERQNDSDAGDDFHERLPYLLQDPYVSNAADRRPAGIGCARRGQRIQVDGNSLAGHLCCEDQRHVALADRIVGDRNPDRCRRSRQLPTR